MQKRIDMNFRKVITLSNGLMVTIKPLGLDDKAMVAQSFKEDADGSLVTYAKRLIVHLAFGVDYFHEWKSDDPLEVMRSLGNATLIKELMNEILLISNLSDDEAKN